jgi:hypothetical protein
MSIGLCGAERALHLLLKCIEFQAKGRLNGFNQVFEPIGAHARPLERLITQLHGSGVKGSMFLLEHGPLMFQDGQYITHPIVRLVAIVIREGSGRFNGMQFFLILQDALPDARALFLQCMLSLFTV